MIVINITENFWELNAQIKHLTPYNKLYKEDESNNKDYSSRQMWCIVMMQDVSSQNSYRTMPYDQKLDACKDYFPLFEIEDVKEQFDAYPSTVMTDRQLAYKKSTESLHKQTDIMGVITNTLHNMAEENPLQFIDKDVQGLWAKLGVMRKGMSKIYEEHSAIEKLMKEEEGESILFGGGVENFVDKGEMIDLDDEY